MKTRPEETYLYEQLAQELSQQISDGVYAVGEKLRPAP
jgi:DNA-binding GntR family transcriptional regulator